VHTNFHDCLKQVWLLSTLDSVKLAYKGKYLDIQYKSSNVLFISSIRANIFKKIIFSINLCFRENHCKKA